VEAIVEAILLKELFTIWSESSPFSILTNEVEQPAPFTVAAAAF
jgi:hypothetical protein